MLHQCPHCHTHFDAHPAAVYCSHNCQRKAYWRRRHLRDANRPSVPGVLSAAIPPSRARVIKLGTDKYDTYASNPDLGADKLENALTPEQIAQLEPAAREAYEALRKPKPKSTGLPSAPDAPSALSILEGIKDTRHD